MSWPSISALTAGTSRSAWIAGLHEEAHEAELHAVALLEQVLVLVPELHDGAHVHVVERGEHRRRVLRVLEAPGDGLPQPRHAHALLARGVVGHRRRAHLLQRHRRRRHRRDLGHGLGRRRLRGPGRGGDQTSSFSTWPRRPEPGTSSAARPFSSISLRAAGAGGMSPLASPRARGPARLASAQVGGGAGLAAGAAPRAGR